MTVGRRLVALRATSGELDTTFGTEGSIDMGVAWGGVPLVYKNIVVVGSNNGEVTQGPRQATRKRLSADGRETLELRVRRAAGRSESRQSWLDEGWKNRQGVNHWGWYFTLDEQREILYTVFGSPAGNYWGGDRPGSNLYGNSVVAVNVNTGKYLWHFQSVHHDLWDSDQPSPPTLIDVTRNGQRVPALGLISKTAWMFVLDRASGTPVFGVEERPVPKGDVPDEWYSPTQPFPVKPAALARVDFKKEDLVTAADTTPEHEKNCLALWEKAGGFYNAGPFTPFHYQAEGAPAKSTDRSSRATAARTGGSCRRSGARLHLRVHAGCGAHGMGGEEAPRRQLRQRAGLAAAVRPRQHHRTGSVLRVLRVDGTGSAAGSLSASAVGTSHRRERRDRRLCVADHVGCHRRPAAGETEHRARRIRGTNGDCRRARVHRHDRDARFRAIDSKTGKELCVTKLNATGSATPMTYQGQERQAIRRAVRRGR